PARGVRHPRNGNRRPPREYGGLRRRGPPSVADGAQPLQLTTSTRSPGRTRAVGPGASRPTPFTAASRPVVFRAGHGVPHHLDPAVIELVDIRARVALLDSAYPRERGAAGIEKCLSDFIAFRHGSICSSASRSGRWATRERRADRALHGPRAPGRRG